jgi:hypothetical protein
MFVCIMSSFHFHVNYFFEKFSFTQTNLEKDIHYWNKPALSKLKVK